MIYLELIWGFLQVGCLAFGGAYAAIPFIRDIVLHYGWLDEGSLSYIIAISESTPGPIMINMATYVGQSQGGFWGAIVATTAVILPAFFITILIMSVLQSAIDNRRVKLCLNGLMPCIAGIVTATGLSMFIASLGTTKGQINIGCDKLAIAIAIIGIELAYWRTKKIMLSPILLIVISALFGAIFL